MSNSEDHLPSLKTAEIPPAKENPQDYNQGLNQNSQTPPDLSNNQNTQSIPKATNYKNTDVDYNKKGSTKNVFIILGSITSILILIIILGTFVVSILVAYDKIKLPSEKLQNKISYIIQEIPFTPKTPRYILAKAIKSHENISSVYIDASIAISGNSITSFLGPNNLDFLITGPINSTDPENPEFSFNVQIANDFDMDLMSKDEMGYFRINQFPSLVLTRLKVPPHLMKNNPNINRWVRFDNSNLDTEARKALRENSENNESDTIAEKKLLQLFEKKLLPEMKVSSEKYQENQTYKISMKLDKDQVAEVMTEFSNIVSDKVDLYADTDARPTILTDLNMDLWIDKEDYYVRKVILETRVSPDYYKSRLKVLGTSTISDMITNPDDINIAFALTMNNFGKNFEIKAPTDSISFEEYLPTISMILGPALQLTQPKPLEDTQDSFGISPN